MIIGWIAFMALVAAGFAWLGIWHVKGQVLTGDDYFNRRGTAGITTATATLVASMAGAWILFSPAETATWAGLPGLLGYSIGQALPLLGFAVIAPRLRRQVPDGRSLADFTRIRYGNVFHRFILGVTLFYMAVFLTAELTGIALVVRFFTDVPLWVTAAVIMAGTFAYTARGGIKASIFTDRIQFFIMVPLLLLVLWAVLSRMGGWEAAAGRIRENAPELMRLDFVPGVRFGLTLMIAVLAANMFHQGLWQRVYTGRDARTTRWAFGLAGLLVAPLVLLPGLFGLLAFADGLAQAHSSTALFEVARMHLPSALVYGFILLAVCLVMSSLDTLMNGLECTLATARAAPPGEPSTFRRHHGGLVAILLPALFIAAQGYSVLYLFLVADLVCAAVLVPVFLGLYSRRYTARAALASSCAGIAAGLLFFMKPDFSPLFPVPGGGDALISFSAALGVGGLCAFASLLRRPVPPPSVLIQS